MVEEKRKQLVTFLSRECLDPKSRLPHPPTRVQQALEKIRFAIDPFEDIEKQAGKAIKDLRVVLPISIEKIAVSFKVPAEYASRTYGKIKSFGTIKSETWTNDGSLISIIEMPAGLYRPFLEKIGEITRGNLEAKIVK
jgi:ribosome maturation protein SDO1